MIIKLKYEQEVAAPYKENLVRARNINPISVFLDPVKSCLQDPICLGKDECEKAKKMLDENIYKNVLIVVDSDCDGYCSAAILVNYLQAAYELEPIDNMDFHYYIHEKKQHGLEDVAQELDLNQFNLVLIPDAGSNDDEYFAQAPDTKFIVLDHHERENKALPAENVVIINNQLAEQYVNKSLSGAGVTWQFCRYLDQCNNTNYADDLMDLTAVAIIADIMDITTLENRYIIDTGLNQISNRFLKILIDNAAFQLGNKITPTGIAFYIVPAINSMCRVGTMEEKNRMFLAFIAPDFMVESHKRGVAAGTKVAVATESGRECTNAKARQKRIQTKMAELCDQQIIEKDLTKNKIFTIVLDENFEDMPSEMNGLAATKISNDYGHPTLIGRVNSEGIYKGSIRGLSTIDMPPFKEFLLNSGFFEMVQGHNNAAGFAMNYARLDQFNTWANEQLSSINMNDKTWFVDFIVDADGSELKEIIKAMGGMNQYWGQGFPEALISINEFNFDRADVTVMGKSSDTVKIMHNGIAYMFFKRSMEEVQKLVSCSHGKISVVGTANLNEYYGRITPQIFVSDYTFVDDSYAF